MDNIQKITKVDSQINTVKFIKADDNKVIRESAIVWMKKMDECIYICNKTNGCRSDLSDVNKVSKINNPTSYESLSVYF